VLQNPLTLILLKAHSWLSRPVPSGGGMRGSPSVPRRAEDVPGYLSMSLAEKVRVPRRLGSGTQNTFDGTPSRSIRPITPPEALHLFSGTNRVCESYKVICEWYLSRVFFNRCKASIFETQANLSTHLNWWMMPYRCLVCRLRLVWTPLYSSDFNATLIFYDPRVFHWRLVFN